MHIALMSQITLKRSNFYANISVFIINFLAVFTVLPRGVQLPESLLRRRSEEF